MTTLHHEPSGRLGQQEGEEDEGDSREGLETEGKTPLERSTHSSLLATVTDPCGDKRSDTKEKLECSGQSASIGRVGDLRLIERSQDTLESARPGARHTI